MTDPVYEPITEETKKIIRGFTKGPTLPPIPPGIGANVSEEDNGRMEARLIKLEEFADDAKQRLARVETKLDHIDKEVSNFKWWVLAQIVAALLTVVGTGIAIQQMTVSTFQAAGVQSQPTPQPPIIINVPQAAPAPSPAPAN